MVVLEGNVMENGLVLRLASGRKQLYVPAELEENVMNRIHISHEWACRNREMYGPDKNMLLIHGYEK